MGLWQDIDSSRYAEDTYWYPNLTLDLFGRDWGSFFTDFVLLINDDPLLETAGTWFTIGCDFPSSIDADSSFACALKLHLEFNLASSEGDPGVPWSDTLKLKINSDGQVNILPLSGNGFPQALIAIDRLWYMGSVPTGMQTLSIISTDGPAYPYTAENLSDSLHRSYLGFTLL
jgi:hypothetical protein